MCNSILVFLAHKHAALCVILSWHFSYLQSVRSKETLADGKHSDVKCQTEKSNVDVFHLLSYPL